MAALPAWPANHRHRPPAAANTALATEMKLGRTPLRASEPATAAAQRELRERIGRRVGCMRDVTPGRITVARPVLPTRPRPRYPGRQKPGAGLMARPASAR